jgi:hypothetical protein
MPASAAVLLSDLESLLQRALSRTGKGAWEAAEEALGRSASLMPALLRKVDGNEPGLRRCFELLSTLRIRFTEAQDATREELSEIRQAKSRLRPTRQAYRRSIAPTAGRFNGTA